MKTLELEITDKNMEILTLLSDRYQKPLSVLLNFLIDLGLKAEIERALKAVGKAPADIEAGNKTIRSKICPWCGQEVKEYGDHYITIQNVKAGGERWMHLECMAEAEEILMPRMLGSLDCETCGKGIFY